MTSKRGGAVDAWSFGKNRTDSAIAKMPNGTLMKKSQCHDACCRMRPASAGPKIGPVRTGTARIPMTRAIWPGATRAIIICAIGASRPPAIP
jgi:hypothetical protein